METCSECSQERDFIYKGTCLECLWSNSPTELQVCYNCGIPKPLDLYSGKDKTCKLCRKLVKLGIKTAFSPRLNLSLEVIHDHVDGKVHCVTCSKLVPLEDLARNSYECSYCWGVRNLTELQFYMNLNFYIKCLACGGIFPINNYFTGRLKCKCCVQGNR